MSRRSFGVVVVGLLAGATCTWMAPATVQANPPVARDADVIVEWNKITERTLAENPAPNAPPNEAPLFRAFMYYGFTALAMYDAVVTIEGGYQPWTKLPRAKAHASPEVAAVTAAYRVLRHYFPNSAGGAGRRLQGGAGRRSPTGSARCTGSASAEDAAAALIARHPEQGINAPFPQPHDEPLEPGEWRPTASRPDGCDLVQTRRPVGAPRPHPPPRPPRLDQRPVRRRLRRSPRLRVGDRRHIVPKPKPTPPCSTRSPPASNTSTPCATRSPAATSTSSTPPTPWPCSTPASPTPPSPAGATSGTTSSGARKPPSPSPTPTTTPPPTSCPAGPRYAPRRPTPTTPAATPASPDPSPDPSTTSSAPDRSPTPTP